MAQSTQVYAGTLTVLECADCHIPFGVTQRFEEDRRDDHKNFYCPRGHVNYWPQTSERERLRKEKAVLQRQLDNALDRETRQQERANAAERSARALKGHLTRMRKRVANGVCPVPGCKRHFPNVQAHVESCHSDWLNEHPEVFEPVPA